jgi:S-adenosylmethionine:tRNA ribosyltransferase-isomerase
VVKTSDLDFDLPERLIASHPPATRAAARLMVAHAKSGALQFTQFAALPQFLRAGDLLVLNDTRVLPARLKLHKLTGGVIEGLFLYENADGTARCMMSGGRLREGVELVAAEPAGERTAILRLVQKRERGEWQVQKLSADSWITLLERIGSTPLPPYIRRLRIAAREADDSVEDRERYQTLWAQQNGSVAAPTASLHFDADLLQRLVQLGVQFAHLTLHVGQGTFLPVDCERLEDHPMHSERFIVGAELEEQLRLTREHGGRVIAVGTTVCRALEAWARGDRVQTELLILPGFEFQIVDALITNFHTPRSTLLALVAGVAQAQGAEDGLAFVKTAYAAAIAENMRFYSYGDASLWLRD